MNADTIIDDIRANGPSTASQIVDRVLPDASSASRRSLCVYVSKMGRDGRLRVVGTSGRGRANIYDVGTVTAPTAIAGYLRANGTGTLRDIRDALRPAGFSDSTVSGAISRMLDRGELVRVGRRAVGSTNFPAYVYALPESGAVEFVDDRVPCRDASVQALTVLVQADRPLTRRAVCEAMFGDCDDRHMTCTANALKRLREKGLARTWRGFGSTHYWEAVA